MNSLEKILDTKIDLLTKGKKADIGEIRSYPDGTKRKKVGPGKWVPVSSSGGSDSSGKDEGKLPSKEKLQELVRAINKKKADIIKEKGQKGYNDPNFKKLENLESQALKKLRQHSEKGSKSNDEKISRLKKKKRALKSSGKKEKDGGGEYKPKYKRAGGTKKDTFKPNYDKEGDKEYKPKYKKAGGTKKDTFKPNYKKK